MVCRGCKISRASEVESSIVEELIGFGRGSRLGAKCKEKCLIDTAEIVHALLESEQARGRVMWYSPLSREIARALWP